MGSPAITVLCPTAHPGPLVGESLGALREVVDEIVIAADSRVEDTDLAYYADVADTVLRYEHAGPNRHWPWLAEQAGGDWVLLLDGDEVVGEALIEALPELVTDRRVRQYSLPIHWPWPTVAERLTDHPWKDGGRLRLLRNDPGLTFAARKHALADPDPPIHYVEEELPVYHLDLLMPDRARREAKVEHYDNQMFGLLTAEGLPLNHACYLPEDRGTPPATAPIPAADAERIARALAATRDESRSIDRGSLPLVGREEVVWYAPREVLPDDAYRGKVTARRGLPSFTAGRDDHLVWVEVTNEGTARWPGGNAREPRIRLGASWRRPDGGPAEDVGRTMLPHVLDPGQSAYFPALFKGPTEPGEFELVLGLVHEGMRWFEDPFTAPVEVGPTVGQRLAALAERHGELIPLEAMMAERRAIGAIDGLLRPGDETRPSDPAIAALTASLPVGAWAVDAPAIDRLVELVREERPPAIVEFGSGTSTVILASLLAEIHGEGLRLLSFEQDPIWAEHTRGALFERGLELTAQVMHLPVGELPGGPPGYSPTAEASALLAELEPRLIFVDGPTLASGASRLGTVEMVVPHLREDATLVLDDALRDAELRVAETWDRRDDVTVHGIRPTPKGLLEGTLRAPSTS